MKIACLLLFLFSFAGTDDIPSDKREMRRLLKKEKTALHKIKIEERSLLKKIDDFQKKIFKSDMELVKIKFSIKEKEDDLRKLEHDLQNAMKIINHQTRMVGLIANRVNRLYGTNNTDFMESIFNSGNINTLRTNLKLSEIFISEYFRLLAILNLTNTQTQEKIARVTTSTEALRNIQKKEAHIFTRRKDSKKELLALLKKVENEKSLHLKYITELKAADGRLDRKIAALKVKESLLTGLLSMKSILPFPLKGAVTQKYGRQVNKRFNTVHFNKGIVIEGKSNSSVSAIGNGIVVYSDWFKGYGNIIIINHGDNYYSLYARNANLLKKTGQKVACGELIARASSNEKGRPSIYFQLRHQKKTLNPLNWLKN